MSFAFKPDLQFEKQKMYVSLCYCNDYQSQSSLGLDRNEGKSTVMIGDVNSRNNC